MPDSLIAYYSTETIVNFKCGHCLKWWVIQDADLSRGYYCPWCGTYHGICREIPPGELLVYVKDNALETLKDQIP